MSSAPSPAATANGSPAPAARPSWRPRLAVVPNPAPARSVAPFLLLCATILAGALLTVLLLNTQMAAAAYQISDQQVALNRLDENEASLRAQVETAASPAVLQDKAERLGMVPAEDVRYIHLEDRTVLGGEKD